jgi:hypothetical protein
MKEGRSQYKDIPFSNHLKNRGTRFYKYPKKLTLVDFYTVLSASSRHRRTGEISPLADTQRKGSAFKLAALRHKIALYKGNPKNSLSLGAPLIVLGFRGSVRVKN